MSSARTARRYFSGRWAPASPSIQEPGFVIRIEPGELKGLDYADEA